MISRNFRPVAGYCIRSCPRYHDTTEEVRVNENFLAQSTFWNAVRFLLIGQTGVSVELRFASSAGDRSTQIFLFVYTRNDGRPIDAIESLERLLPLDYTWCRVPIEELQSLVASTGGAPHWFISKLIRRLEFIDLPTNQPWMFSRFGGGEDQAAASAGSPFGGNAGMGSVAKRGTRVTRKMPDIYRPIWSQFKTDSLCLPFLNGMSDQSADRHRLCLELQYSAPVVLSISLHSVDEDSLEQDREIAGHLRRCLDPFADAMANTGFSVVRAIYDRYFLPVNYLCNLMIRVAAPDTAKAVGVAHSMAAQLGGTTAFEIYPSPNVLRSLENMALPDNDLPPSSVMARATSRDWMEEQPRAEWLAKLRPRLKRITERIDVDFDAELFSFLIRLPHLFSLNEMDCVLRLPYAAEKGLPGVQTSMVPPFYSAGSQFVPFADPAPSRAIRVGVARTSAVIVNADSDTSNGFASSDMRSGQWHCIRSRDLTKHALIVGSTGSGKSVTTQFFLRELRRLDVPFLVVEPVKTEYVDRLRANGAEVRQINLEGTVNGERSPSYLCFDPMRLQNGITVARHISYLKSCFLAAFPLDEVLTLVLENGLREYYTAPREVGGCGLKLLESVENGCWSGPSRIFANHPPVVYPSFKTFSDFFLKRFIPKDLNIEAMKAQGGANNSVLQRAEEWRQLFTRRFNNLTKGPLGEAFKAADDEFLNTGNADHMAALLRGNTVLELDSVPDNDDKALIMAFLMTFLFERRQAEDMLRRRKGEEEVSDVRHVLVIEEAHRLLANQSAAGRSRGESAGSDSKQKAVSLFVDMLAEIRAYGQGIAIVEQIPTKIVPEAVKNTNLKIMLRLTSKEDREFLGDAMNFTDAQKNFVNNLKTGQFVIFEEGVDQPLLASLPAESMWSQLP